MRYALLDDQRAEAAPGLRADCPTCLSRVLAKCGEIVRWHWAHVGRDDCDHWAEEPNTWHRSWQEFVPEAWREVTMGCHRADILAIDGTVVELQHSYLPADQIREREGFYRRMVWLFDATEAIREDRLLIRDRTTHVTFRWKHPRKSLALCQRPVLLDLGADSLLKLRRFYPGAPCGGWGNLISKAEFIAWMTRDSSAKEEMR